MTETTILASDGNCGIEVRLSEYDDEGGFDQAVITCFPLHDRVPLFDLAEVRAVHGALSQILARYKDT